MDVVGCLRLRLCRFQLTIALIKLTLELEDVLVDGQAVIALADDGKARQDIIGRRPVQISRGGDRRRLDATGVVVGGTPGVDKALAHRTQARPLRGLLRYGAAYGPRSFDLGGHDNSLLRFTDPALFAAAARIPVAGSNLTPTAPFASVRGGEPHPRPAVEKQVIGPEPAAVEQ